MEYQPELTIADSLIRSDKLFVYGTLKRGYSNQWAVQSAELLATDDFQMEGILFQTSQNFPALNLTEARSPIHGEIYKINHKVMTDCDRLESHPNWYRRELVYLKPWGFVWTYLMPRAHTEHFRFWIKDGHWKGPSTQTEHWDGWKKQTPDEKRQYWTLPAPGMDPEFFYFINPKTRYVVGPCKVSTSADGKSKPKISIPAITRAVQHAVGPQLPASENPGIIVPEKKIVLVEKKAPEVDHRFRIGPGLREV